MRYTAWLLCAAVGLGACGQEKTPGTGDENSGSHAATPTTKPAPAKPRIDRAALEKQRAELEAKLAALLGRRKEMEARHARELADLPSTDEIADVRRRASSLRRDAMRSTQKMRRMERRFAELKKQAEAALTGSIKALREKEKGIAGRLKGANAIWSKARARDRLGGEAVSPVQVDLDTIRAIKTKWFELTPEARRSRLASDRRKAVNDSFRGWIGGEPKRKEICAKILAQPLAPKGLTVARYDFTRLDFFVMLELLENEIDKLNIAVEKKVSAEQENKVDAINAELEAIREQITKAMQAGGSELEEYVDLKARIKTARSLDERIRTEYELTSEVMNQVLTARDKVRKETDEMEEAAKQLQRELAGVMRKLRG